MSQLHAQASLAQRSGSSTHRIEGLLGTSAGLENLKMIKKNSLPLNGIEKIPHFKPLPSHFTDNLTMVKIVCLYKHLVFNCYSNT